MIIVNETPINLKRSATQFVHINENSYDAFVLSLLDKKYDKTSTKKLGIDKSELEKMRETIASTEGDLIIMFGGDLSEEATAVLANSASQFESETCKVLFHPLPLYNNSVGANDMMEGKKPLAQVLKESKAVIIAGSLPDAGGLQNKDFVVVQELFETETTDYADVILPAASFAEVDGTFTNNAGNVQRVRQAIELVNQAKPDWLIADLIAKELGVDFGYQRSASAVFKSIADRVEAYEGLRYPLLKDESNPVQVAYKLNIKKT